MPRWKRRAKSGHSSAFGATLQGSGPYAFRSTTRIIPKRPRKRERRWRVKTRHVLLLSSPKHHDMRLQHAANEYSEGCPILEAGVD
jgi:hypothetical protein